AGPPGTRRRVTGVTAMPAPEEPIVEINLAELDADPYPALARLRERTPAAWIPALDGWIVTRRDLCIEVMRDATRFTVDDPRFSTARVVGPSMLSLDGAEHRRHRDPFARRFRLAAVREALGPVVTREAERLIDGVAAAGEAELRAAFTAPLAAAVM